MPDIATMPEDSEASDPQTFIVARSVLQPERPIHYGTKTEEALAALPEAVASIIGSALAVRKAMHNLLPDTPPSILRLPFALVAEHEKVVLGDGQFPFLTEGVIVTALAPRKQTRLIAVFYQPELDGDFGIGYIKALIETDEGGRDWVPARVLDIDAL